MKVSCEQSYNKVILPQVNGASISSESISSESESHEEDRIPYSRVRPQFQQKLDKTNSKIEKDVRESEEDITKETSEQLADLQEDLQESQQKLDKNFNKSTEALAQLSSSVCTADSILVNLSEKLDACFEGSETKALANGDQGLRRLDALSKRYSHIKDSLKECDSIRNDQAAKKCAEGKVRLLNNIDFFLLIP